MTNATPGSAVSLGHAPTNAYEVFTDSDYQEDFDFATVDDDETTYPQPTRRPVPWGQGVEARRASQYRRYDISSSKIFSALQFRYGTVTRVVLDELIVAVINSLPDGQRPKPPGRNQRRARNGLVMWLDANSPIVWRYITWNLMVDAYGMMIRSCEA
jgi:hypothetical protein